MIYIIYIIFDNVLNTDNVIWWYNVI